MEPFVMRMEIEPLPPQWPVDACVDSNIFGMEKNMTTYLKCEFNLFFEKKENKLELITALVTIYAVFYRTVVTIGLREWNY